MAALQWHQVYQEHQVLWVLLLVHDLPVFTLQILLNQAWQLACAKFVNGTNWGANIHQSINQKQSNKENVQRVTSRQRLFNWNQFDASALDDHQDSSHYDTNDSNHKCPKEESNNSTNSNNVIFKLIMWTMSMLMLMWTMISLDYMICLLSNRRCQPLPQLRSSSSTIRSFSCLDTARESRAFHIYIFYIFREEFARRKLHVEVQLGLN